MAQIYLIAAITAAAFFAVVTLILLFQLRERNRETSMPSEFMAKMDRIDTIAREMETLTRAFLVPRTRGGMGEQLLEDLLKAWLPPQYILLQHRFNNGARVDAAVKVGDRIVSIDAKFPYESIAPLLDKENSGSNKTRAGELRRIFCGYVDDIAAKYIRPEEKTFHFALLYIPSENLYYRAFIEEQSGLMDYALKQSVVPVSPGSLFIYLQTIAVGLKGFALSKHQKELMETLYTLQRDFRSFAKSYTVTGTQLRNAARNFEDSLGSFVRLESTLERLIDKGPENRPEDT
ncbi:DNA recombination protein RmuC [Marispirochaeta sp.]|uniref:DNA recombination protein RmuC n=1 Tax=Marispirochaeta sp. TaxID=2038653 RepID=UPI0029C741F7|nr:DNA recombination protein RmuC [Marispirochaeta sp.]